MMKKPFVSVIVPAYNEEKYIGNCLKSLKNQGYNGKYEIIVVDNASRDKTSKIAKKFADKVVLCKKRGPALARNAGAKFAQGEILIFLDADSIASFNLITELVKAYKRKDVVGASCYILPLSPKIGDIILYSFFNQFIKASIFAKRPQIAGTCCSYRKKIFEKVHGFNENLKVYEDYDIIGRISKFGKIKFADSTFVLNSVRRLKKWGRGKIAMRYIKWYLTYLLTGKTVGANEYKPIR